MTRRANHAELRAPPLRTHNTVPDRRILHPEHHYARHEYIVAQAPSNDILHTQLPPIHEMLGSTAHQLHAPYSHIHRLDALHIPAEVHTVPYVALPPSAASRRGSWEAPWDQLPPAHSQGTPSPVHINSAVSLPYRLADYPPTNEDQKLPISLREKPENAIMSNKRRKTDEPKVRKPDAPKDPGKNLKEQGRRSNISSSIKRIQDTLMKNGVPLKTQLNGNNSRTSNLVYSKEDNLETGAAELDRLFDENKQLRVENSELRKELARR